MSGLPTHPDGEKLRGQSKYRAIRKLPAPQERTSRGISTEAGRKCNQAFTLATSSMSEIAMFRRLSCLRALIHCRTSPRIEQEIAEISKESSDFLRSGRKDVFSLGEQERRNQRGTNVSNCLEKAVRTTPKARGKCQPRKEDR